MKDGEDAADIKAKTEALAQASMKIGEAMYKDQAAASQGPGPGDAGGPGGPGASSTADEGIVDAEFQEVDEDKKRSA